MPKYFYLCPRAFKILFELGLSSECACVCLRVELVLHSEYSLYLRCSSEEDVPVDLHFVILVDEDGAHVVFVA